MTFLYVITIVIAFTLIIVIHELGHFIAGKLFNFRIEVFSIGMGKRMWGITRGETDYRISMIPVGGFVAFGGISDTEGPAETGDPRDMPNRPVWQRMIVIFAGPLMNLVSGLILAVIIFAIGAQFTSAQIGAVNPASPAAVAGIKVGDRVTRIDGTLVNSFTDIQQDVALSRIGTPMAFEIERDGKTITLNVASEKNAGDLFPTIGIQPPTSNIIHADTAELTSAGFQTGDTILSVNGKPVGDFNAGDTINGEILASPNKEVTFIVKRGDAEHTILVTPRPIYSYLLDAAIMPAIGSVEPDLPAAKAGILAGDYIVEIAGQRMEGFESIVKAVSGSEGEVSITVLRGNERREFKMTPIANDKEGRKMVGIRVNPDEPRYRAIWVTKGSTAEQAGLKEGDYIKSFTVNNLDGFADIKLESGGEVRFTARRDESVTPVGLFGVNLLYKQEIIRAKSIGEAFSRGWNDCVQIVDKTYLFLAKLLSAQVSAKLVSGPVGIVNISYKVLSVGVMVFLHFLVLISINLAVVNLLPLPILDGGNIVMLAIEWVRGKPLSIKVQQVVVQVGLVLILGIFLLATGNDIYHLIFGY